MVECDLTDGTAMHIHDIFAQRDTTVSFEFFPPKSEDAAAALYTNIAELEELRPSFVSVTYGAGGSTREVTNKLVVRLKKTNARLIWAHTTFVPEKEAGRKMGDDVKYNEAAARVMKKHGIPINDLHALTRSFPAELFVRPGDVHYKPEGYRKVGRQVAVTIAAAINGKKKVDSNR